MTSSRANRRGIFALMGAMAAFAVNDMVMKLTAQRYALGEVITVRGAIATLLVGSIVLALGQITALRFVSPLVLSRTMFDGLAMVLFTTALIHMPLAELSAINLVSPLIITAAAVIFFRDGDAPGKASAAKQPIGLGSIGASGLGFRDIVAGAHGF